MASNNNRKKKKSLSNWFVENDRPSSFVIDVIVTTCKMLAVLVIACSVACCGLVVGLAKGYYETTPELNTSEINDQSLTSFFYDKDGELLTAYKGSENRVWAKYEELPEDLKNAFVALEDARFWTHNGIDLKRIAGAFISNLSGGSTQGGSTITQQLIKLRVLSTEVSYKRKIQEAFLAIELEEQYEKEQILESYLNSIWMGESNYGVKAAAQDYFGKELDELTLKECAMLAGITKNPSRYNPRKNYVRNDTPEISEERTERALYAMLENNFITQTEYEEALGQEIAVVEQSTVNKLYDMPYAVETVLNDVIDAFIELYGVSNTSQNRSIIRSEIQTNGYHIYSTIDSKVQKIAEDVVYNWDSYPEMANPSDAIVRTVGSDGVITEQLQPQAAVVIYDHEAGELRGIVGGRSEPSSFLEYNRATSSVMPVGSSIKPLAVYGPALDMGFSPATVTENMEVPIEGWSTEKGYPSNSSSLKKSMVTLRTSMVNSLNIGSVHTLLDYVGIDNSTNYLNSMGIDSSYLNIDAFGLAMGSSGITPFDMAVGFGTIANAGTYKDAITFTKVTDANGNVLIDNKAKQAESEVQVFRPGAAYMLCDMLVDAVQSGTGKNARISGLTVGGKTGTNSDYVGVSFSGITPHYSCSVWIGHDSYKALYKGASGGNEAAPMFKAVMEKVYNTLELENKAIIEFSPEELGLTQAVTCSLSGLLATDACYFDLDYPPVTEYWFADSVPTDTCVTHQIANICSESGLPATAYCPNPTQGSVTVISPDLTIYKYDRATLSRFFPKAFYQTTYFRTPVDGAGDDIGLILPDYSETDDIFSTGPMGFGDAFSTRTWSAIDTMAENGGYCNVHTEFMLPSVYDPIFGYSDPVNPGYVQDSFDGYYFDADN
ncbi:MAG: transglycosylase domain-containing protein [Clostridia bacterium]|nr:transglycosylase domain-containing protein [Clostridia bacterium]